MLGLQRSDGANLSQKLVGQNRQEYGPRGTAVPRSNITKGKPYISN